MRNTVGSEIEHASLFVPAWCARELAAVARPPFISNYVVWLSSLAGLLVYIHVRYVFYRVVRPWSRLHMCMIKITLVYFEL